MGIIGLFAPGFVARMREAEEREEQNQAEYLKQRRTPWAWNEDHTSFDKELYLDAATWKPTLLFDNPPMYGKPNERLSAIETSECIRWSPSRRFFYANHILPAYKPLPIFKGRKRGRVWFNRDIISPALCEVVAHQGTPRVWMSLTPMELLTQRRGVLLATERVVIGGLGLGWFLNKVASKKSVTEIVVVDKEPELLDWLKPVLQDKYPALNVKVSTWVHDDIYSFMETDVPRCGEQTKYLLDIWDTYGGVDGKFYDWKKKLGSRIWGWGDVSY